MSESFFFSSLGWIQHDFCFVLNIFLRHFDRRNLINTIPRWSIDVECHNRRSEDSLEPLITRRWYYWRSHHQFCLVSPGPAAFVVVGNKCYTTQSEMPISKSTWGIDDEQVNDIPTRSFVVCVYVNWRAMRADGSSSWLCPLTHKKIGSRRKVKLPKVKLFDEPKAGWEDCVDPRSRTLRSEICQSR
jgi:hypothetical protein